ncbi:hypothetical protein D9757_011325 [Collybiopsis confluens]|uniref:Protein kinase domain-containing protein n=1 Tax=Collybiopsis confluens TaxID=2823264 RepID=A0A8H5GGV7_9AGAR|nr:hypothetical protein D9757_011325 [Collybiopsis confluens]
MSYFTKDLLVLVLTLILAVHAAPYSAVNRRHVGMIGNAVQSNSSQVQLFNTSIQNELGRLGRRANPNPPTWLLSRFDDPKMLTDADKKVFESKLKGLQLGLRMRFTADAQNNGGLWNVKSYKGYSGSPGDLLLKVIAPHNSGYGEVKALKQVGDFVASGLIKDPGLVSTLDKLRSKSNLRAVIMKKKDGQTLLDLNLLVLGEPVKILACNAAANIAVGKHALHGDLNVGNVLVKIAHGESTVVNLVDWGKGNWVKEG